MTVKTIEDLQAWQLARELCRLIFSLTEKEPFARDWILKKQIRSSSGGAMDCIAEGFERGNNNEFKYFLGVSKGSCGEVRSQAYRALDNGYITEEERLAVDQLARRVAAAVQGLTRYLNSVNKRGQRFDDKDPNFPTT